jgi:hypothetical protein
MSGWSEWSARETRQDAGTEMANLARSLTQHAEDSLDLLDSGIVGVVSRLEMDGTGPATIAKLRNLLDARRIAIDRIHGLAIIDEYSNWLTSSGAVTSELSGDEFFQQHCARVAERVRCALRSAAIPHAPNQPSSLVTASIGGAICRPGVERWAGPALLIEAADRALYAAKAAGRDRLVMAGEQVTFRSVVSA